MKRFVIVIGTLAVLSMVLAIGASAQVQTATWGVATVHGLNEFAIGDGGTSLHYNPQGWTDYVWYNNDGTVAQGLYGDRTGMRTFAMTDVAAGQKLKDLNMSFEYKTALGYTTMNFFMTDGSGNFGIFSPASGGLGKVGQVSTVDSEWSKMTLDMTRSDITNGGFAVYEQSGFVTPAGEPYTDMDWSVIREYQIAGMYDFQRSPTCGWGAWSDMFDPLNTDGNPSVVNGYGLALIWGDTVNSNDSYGQTAKEIRNVKVSFAGTEYTGVFASEQSVPPCIPEPVFFQFGAMMGLGGMGVLKLRKR